MALGFDPIDNVKKRVNIGHLGKSRRTNPHGSAVKRVAESVSGWSTVQPRAYVDFVLVQDLGNGFAVEASNVERQQRHEMVRVGSWHI